MRSSLRACFAQQMKLRRHEAQFCFGRRTSRGLRGANGAAARGGGGGHKRDIHHALAQSPPRRRGQRRCVSPYPGGSRGRAAKRRARGGRRGARRRGSSTRAGGGAECGCRAWRARGSGQRSLQRRSRAQRWEWSRAGGGCGCGRVANLWVRVPRVPGGRRGDRAYACMCICVRNMRRRCPRNSNV